jgi:hypothetical protein
MLAAADLVAVTNVDLPAPANGFNPAKRHLPAGALEQHQPEWNSPADKVARPSSELAHADFFSQTKNALVMQLASHGGDGLDRWIDWLVCEVVACRYFPARDRESVQN